MTRGKRIYVLDTNVLMHDPTALFKFEEHDIYLPKVIPDNAILGAILALKEETPDLPVVFVPRTSTCGSRPPSPASCPRTTKTTARWTIQPALHRRHRAAGRLLEAPRRRPAQLERQGPQPLRIQAQDGEEWYPNQYVYLPGEDEVELRVSRVVGDGKVVLSLVDDSATAATPCGVSVRATASRTSRSTH